MFSFELSSRPVVNNDFLVKEGAAVVAKFRTLRCYVHLSGILLQHVGKLQNISNKFQLIACISFFAL